jgi:hypothetical protein
MDLWWEESGSNCSASGQGPVVGPCEHGNKSSCSVEGGGFLEYTSEYQLLKIYSMKLMVITIVITIIIIIIIIIIILCT